MDLNLIFDDDENIILRSYVHVLIENTSKSDEIEANRNGNPIIRNQNYYETVIPLYSLDDFKDHFRVTRFIFEKLLVVVGNNLTKVHHIPLEKKLLVTLWILAKPDCFLNVADRFNVAKSTLHFIFKELVEVFCAIAPSHIQWPDSTKYKQLSSAFKVKSHHTIPGIIGAIDGCHIEIKQPVGNPIDYYNRKNTHSVILQAVCDHQTVFLDVFVGMPGRLHDARVFKSSPLYRKMVNNSQPLIDPEYHIIGDAAYLMLKNPLCPYRDNGHLTTSQKNFNTKLSSARVTIERAFGLLTGVFRRLKFLDMSDIELINRVILACCFLHNFRIIESNEVLDLEFDEDQMELEDDNVSGNFESDMFDSSERNAGEIKRSYITLSC